MFVNIIVRDNMDNVSAHTSPVAMNLQPFWSCEKFNPSEETIIEFLERFTMQADHFLQNAGNNSNKKAAILIKALPVPVITDLQRRLKPEKLSQSTYEQLVTKLTDQFVVKKSMVGASVKFLSRLQGGNESIEEYARSLNDLASECKYKDCCRDRLLRDSFICGLKSSSIVGGLLQDCETQENKSFNDCVSKAKLLEQISLDTLDLRSDSHVHKVDNRQEYSNKVPNNYTCIRCGVKSIHFANKCPIIKKICSKCNKVGHLARMCRSKISTNHVIASYQPSTHDVDLATEAPTAATNQRSGEDVHSTISANVHTAALGRNAHEKTYTSRVSEMRQPRTEESPYHHRRMNNNEVESDNFYSFLG